MNASTTTDQARIQPDDFSAVRPAHRFMGGGSLAGLEWQRECQAEAEVDWLLRHNGVTPQVSASRVSLLRQTIGAALIRAGARLAGIPGSGESPNGDTPKMVPVAGTVGTAA